MFRVMATSDAVMAAERQIRCALQASRSHEDILLLNLLHAAAQMDPNGNGRGTFVELGALDGEDGSQSYLLETCYNWSGVLIEASPINYAKINTTLRARSAVFNSAVCIPPPGKQTGSVTMMAGGGSVAGVAGMMPRGLEKRWMKERGQATMSVPCKELGRIMFDAGHNGATFLSLDVEGSERIVLDTLNGTAVPFRVVLVEADGRDVSKDRAVRTILTRGGLVQVEHPLIRQSGSKNELFVHPKLNASFLPELAEFRALKAVARNFLLGPRSPVDVLRGDDCKVPSCAAHRPKLLAHSLLGTPKAYELLSVLLAIGMPSQLHQLSAHGSSHGGVSHTAPGVRHDETRHTL